jgi:hypothetical protein
MAEGLVGALDIALALIDERLVAPGFGEIAVEADGGVEVGKGVVVVVQREIGNAAAVIGLGEFGDSEIAVEKSSIALAWLPRN